MYSSVGRKIAPLQADMASVGRHLESNMTAITSARVSTLLGLRSSVWMKQIRFCSPEKAGALLRQR